MKKTIKNLIATTLLATTIIAPMSVSAMNINVEGKIKDFDSFVTNGTTVVQLRELTEMLDLKLGYDNATKVVTVSNEAKTVVIDTVKSTASVDNHPHQKVTVIVKNGKTYLPFRFVGEQFGFEIGYSNGMPTLGTVDAKSFMFTGKSEIENLKTEKEKFSYASQLYNKVSCAFLGELLTGKTFMGTDLKDTPQERVIKLKAMYLELLHSIDYLSTLDISQEYKESILLMSEKVKIYVPVALGTISYEKAFPERQLTDAIKDTMKDLDLRDIITDLGISNLVHYYHPNSKWNDIKTWRLVDKYATESYLTTEPWLQATYNFYTDK